MNTKKSYKSYIETNTRLNNINLPCLKYRATKRTVSWKAYCAGDGAFERLQATIGTKRGWLEINASEGYITEKGRWSGREVMLSLEHANAIKLRDFLNAHLPEEPEIQE